ncbi:hypothetical protein LSH36_75g05000 [Paralvinella palmiformis]|uniref:G-protein coupled receptors family 1 profile domain-containing protein n=1 Tax=Paralvinella palmiformis TaxID=53620 RepID=A0AAD9NCZ7_9ANNE|nr:hypothetical protein LSH36_75g05000 [Paralvinella palmiformis]
MAFFYDDTATVPLPLDPELERWFSANMSPSSPFDGSLTSNISKSSANKTAQVSGPLLTADQGGVGGVIAGVDVNHLTVEQRQAWMYTSQGILYYAFPIEIVCGIVGGLLSLATLGRQKKSSNDSYLIGFTMAAVLLLACGGTLKLQDYTPHSNDYQRLYGYVKSANDWLWYSALWILVVMTLERGLTLIQNRNRTFCSAVQASVVVAMVFSVCLISALPEFWEYEAIETFDYVSNRTLVMSHVSPTADSPEYRILYFWYSITITVFLPYPIMVVMTIVLGQGMRHSRHSLKRRLIQQQQQQHKHSTNASGGGGALGGALGGGAPGGGSGGAESTLSRKISEELHLTRLYIVMVLLYLLLSAPLTFLIITNGITPYWSWPVDNLYNGLYLIFEFVFYFYFSIQLPLYLSYYDKFRHSFIELCCCCCCCWRGRRRRRHRRNSKHKERSSSLRKQVKDDFLYKR